MEKFYEDLLNRLLERHADVDQALQGLSQEAVDWKPRAGMNSLGVLVVHLVGAERYLIGDVVMRDPSNRDRDGEFRTRGLEVETLLKRLRDIEAYDRTAFETLHLSDLATLRIFPRDGSQRTVAGVLLHALDHAALHVGHIQITSELWRQRAGI
jgi:hypothetical protein